MTSHTLNSNLFTFDASSATLNQPWPSIGHYYLIPAYHRPFTFITCVSHTNPQRLLSSLVYHKPTKITIRSLICIVLSIWRIHPQTQGSQETLKGVLGNRVDHLLNIWHLPPYFPNLFLFYFTHFLEYLDLISITPYAHKCRSPLPSSLILLRDPSLTQIERPKLSDRTTVVCCLQHIRQAHPISSRFLSAFVEGRCYGRICS